MIPLIQYSKDKSKTQKTPLSFTILIITKDIKQNEELVQSISDNAKQIETSEQILNNNIIFGEHSTNQKIDYFKDVMKRHREFLLQLEDLKGQRSLEGVEHQIKDIKELKCKALLILLSLIYSKLDKSYSMQFQQIIIAYNFVINIQRKQ